MSVDVTVLLQDSFEHHRAGRIDEAEAGYCQILELQPDNCDALHLLGLVHRARGDNSEAEKLFRSAVALNPQFADAFYNLGNARLSLGNHDGAIAAYGQALELKPDNAAVLFNLGNACRDVGQLDKAVVHFSQAVRVNPRYTEAWHNLANVLKDLGQLELALNSYRKVLKLAPDLAEGHYNFGLAMLLNGDLKRGFAEYEWRWQVANFPSPKRNFPQPLWTGQPLAGKTLLVHTEQGYGDTIQFLRFLPLLAQRGATVVVECPEPIAGLMERINGVAQVVPSGHALPAFDLQCPMMSLALAFDTTLETLPPATPYLLPDADKAERFSALMAEPAATTRIGLVWAGNPLHGNDVNRSIPLKEFLVLPKLPGVEFFSLQKGAAAGDLAATGLSTVVHDLGPHIADFTDLAAAISNLDLVISVDSAPAHLAGLMGKPVWTLLTFAPDWRWLLGREDTPWYPTMRLFRQRTRGDWPEVLLRISAELRMHSR